MAYPAFVDITVWSYVDGLGIAVLTDDLSIKDPHEATDAMTQALAELRSAAGIPAQTTSGGENCVQR